MSAVPVTISRSIALFAELRPNSDKPEVDAAVTAIVDALIASIGTTNDVPEARRSVAGLLDYLHSLKASRHPGRVQLATDLGERVLPLLYAPEPAEEAAKDDYPFLEEETAAADRAADIMGDILAFLCAQDRKNPRYGKEVRDDGIPPLFLFTMDFREGFRRLILALFRSYMRNKHSETSVYKPIRDILSEKTAGDVSRYDRQITSLVRTALDRAQENHSKAQAAAEDEKQQIAPEQEAARDAFEVAQMHARDAGYFLPYSLDFKTLEQIFTLNRKLIIQGLNDLGNAMLQSEGPQYAIRQIDRLNATHDIVHFDVTVLSAFLYGTQKERISYKQMHDACLGAAKTRSGMLEMRPLLVAELARRPHQLARRLVALADDANVNQKQYEDIIDLFTRWLSSLNKRRFEDEISGCATQLKSKPVLKPLLKWIYANKCNLDLVPTAMANTSELRKKIFQAK